MNIIMKHSGVWIKGKCNKALHIESHYNYTYGNGVVECLTRDPGSTGSSLTGVTALWSLSKTHLSKLSTGST